MSDQNKSRAKALCPRIRSSMSAYLDGVLRPEASWEFSQHLLGCEDCADLTREQRRLRAVLRTAPKRTAPPQLAASLRVIASRERTRSQARASWPARRDHWLSNLKLWRDNLMRPFALPVTGGLCSAIVLFSMLVPAFSRVVVRTTDDIPTGLVTEGAVKMMAPIALDSDNVTVELTIDEQGRMVDYSMPPEALNDANLRRSIANNLIFMQFTPATRFGMPTATKLRITFRRSHIDVKG